MNIIWGIILTIIASLGWLGQVITAFWPETAVILSLTEPGSAVDPAFYADMRGEAYWDAVVLWTLPVAGILLILNSPLWAYFGLVGGGMYLYFAGRGIVVRRVMQRREIRIGALADLRIATIFLALWGITAVITIIIAIAALP